MAASPSKLRWPQGQAIEVIVRGTTLGETATAWLLRGAVAPTTRAEVEALARRAADVATTRLGPIGFDATDDGRELYEAGDRHAVITGTADGEVTACVAADDRPTAPVACKRLEVKHGAEVIPVLIELP